MSVQHYGHIKGRIVDAGLLTVNQVPLANVAMSGSASDVQSGVLPVAQVPPLDASQITTGTVALARLPASSSNIFSAYNVAAVSGTNAFPLAGTGSFLGHNRDGARGLTCLANVPAVGTGGWEFVSYTSTGTFNAVCGSLSSTGMLAVNSLAVGPSSLTAGGTMYLGGWLQLAQGTQAGGSQLLLSSTSNTQTHRLATRHYATSAAGNAIDAYLWNYGTDNVASFGSALALSITPVGVGINNTPNPAFGVDCNGSGNFNGMVRGLASGLLMRVFDESATSFPSSGALPEVFAGRPIDTQLLQTITFPQTNAGGGMVAGYTQSYSCRITGYVRAPTSDTYVLSVYTDDGTRVWVNNAKVLDSWQIQGTTVTSTPFALGTAWVPFVLEYVQAGYASGLTVQWRGSGSNTSLSPFTNSSAGFQFACDMYENPGTQFGTSRTSGKALFLSNAGFGGRTAPAVAVDVLGSVMTSADSLLNGALVGNWGAAGTASFGYGGPSASTRALAGTEYAVSQTSTGCTYLNSRAGQGVVFQDGGGSAQMTYVNGQLRIGDGLAPRSTLDVGGVTRLASGQGSLLIGSGTTGTSSMQVIGAGSVFEAGIAGVTGYIVGESAAVDGVVRVVPTPGATQGRLLLQAGSGNVPGVCVGATNMVGIGTASPSYQLDVAGTAHLGSSVQVDGVTFMNNQNSTCMLALNSSTASVPVAASTTFHGFGMQTGALRYQVPTTGSDSHLFFGATTQLMSVAGSGVGVSVPFTAAAPSTLAATTATSLGFPGTATKLTAGTGDWMQINGGGGATGLVVNYNSQVGIGTTTPKYALDVLGTARVQTSGAPAAFYSMANGQTANFWYAGSDQNNNYVVYNQGNTGVYLTNGATSWSSNSDARLKRDVQTLSSTLDTLDRIRPVSFKWRATGRGSVGVIAQELREVLPELVDEMVEEHYPVDMGRLGVRYQELLPFMIRGIQELRAEVRGLRALIPDGPGPTPPPSP